MFEYRAIRLKWEGGEVKIQLDSMGIEEGCWFSNEIVLLNYLGKGDWELVESRTFDTLIFKRKIKKY